LALDLLAVFKGLSPAPLLEGFEQGGTKLVSSEMLGQYPGSPTIGLPAGTFIAPTVEIDAMLAQGLSRSQIAEKLGINNPAFLKGDLIRVDLSPNALRSLNLRPPSGGEAGANNLFIPGGKTVGGVTEGVVNGIPVNGIGVTQKVVNTSQ